MAHTRPGLSLIEEEYWYAGPISERKAERVLCKLGEPGVFLVRDSLLPEADFVLSVNSGTEIWHYDIKVDASNECVFNNYNFTSLPAAIIFYTENRLGSVFLKEPEGPVVTDQTQVSQDIGPRIKVAGSAPPRANPIPSQGYSSITPRELNPKAGWQEAGNIDSGYNPSSSSASATSDSPNSGHSPKPPNPKHFVFNTTTPSSESPEKDLDHTYATPPDVLSMYVNPEEISTDETFLDHTYAQADPHFNDSSILGEVKGKKEAQICETKFDAVTMSTVVGDTQSISTITSENQLVTVDHITTEKGEEYALVSKNKTQASATATEAQSDVDTTYIEGTPVDISTPNSTQAVAASIDPADPVLKDRKEEQKAELRRLPSINQKRQQLEKRLRGEEVESPPISPEHAQHPRRLSIPEGLQNMPAAPPMSTHPGLHRKCEMLPPVEQPQPREVPRKRSFLKKRDSKKEKRNPLEEAVPTPVTTPKQETELKAAFASITKQEWNTDTFISTPSPAPYTRHEDTYSGATSFLVQRPTSTRPVRQPSSLAQVVPGLQQTQSEEASPYDSSRKKYNTMDRMQRVQYTSATAVVERKALTPILGGRRRMSVEVSLLQAGPMNTKRRSLGDLKRKKSFLFRNK